MSEAPHRLPPPRNTALLPALGAVTYLACLVALWGVTSLVLDREVMDYPDAGPLLAPAMAAAASVVTWALLLRTRRSPSPWPWAAASAALSFAAMLAVAAVGYSITRGDFGWMPAAAVHFALSPFVLGAALLSGLVVLAVWAMHPVRGRDDGPENTP